MKGLVVAASALAVAFAAPARTHAQRTPPARRQEPIEIRGQVPTPQVVTVRPREVPAYDRRILVPNFYDHDFWQSILPAYQIAPRRALKGSSVVDTVGRAPSAVSPAPAGTTAPPGRERARDGAARARTGTPSAPE